MKQILYIGILAGFIFDTTSCSKSKTSVQASSLLKGRVIEFGSELPLGNVAFSFSLCVHLDYFSCSESIHTSGSTSFDGSFVIPGEYSDILNRYRSHIADSYEFSKSGYWNNSKADLFFGQPDGSDLPGIIFFANSTTDSLLVKLFPVVNVLVHAKNTGTIQADAYLECQGLYSATDTPRVGKTIFLRTGIDTTFNYPVFGNVQNKLYVKRSVGGANPDTLITLSRFIAKGDNLNLEIIY